MKTARRGGGEPQPAQTIDNSLFPARFYKNSGRFQYTHRKCEFCHAPLTWHDRQEAPYADGQFFCAVCRSEYMELRHSDPALTDDKVLFVGEGTTARVGGTAA